MENSSLPRHPPLDATLASVDGETVLTLQRLLSAPAADVWTALTARRLVARWAPYRPSRDLTEPGPVELPESPSPSTDETGNSGGSRGDVVSVVPGRMLSLEWGGDTLDVEVVPADSGTQLRLSHTFSDPDNAASDRGQVQALRQERHIGLTTPGETAEAGISPSTLER